MAQLIPDLFMRCAASVLHAASTTPIPMGNPLAM